MIHGRVPVAKSQARRLPRGAWKVLRGLFLMLAATLWSVERLPAGKLKSSGLRLLSSHIGALEHGLRCLLLLMRAPPAPQAKMPEGLPRRSHGARAPRRASKRFSLSLSALAKGFARYGRQAPALTPKKARVPAPSKPPRGPTASAPVADPAEALAARLTALRAVFADPAGHAARLSAILRAKGITLRAMKALVPAADLWTRMNHSPRVQDPALRAPLLNTS